MKIIYEKEACVIELSDQEVKTFVKHKKITIEKKRMEKLMKPMLDAAINIFHHYNIEYKKDK